jgi:hypothetical protein
VGEQHHEAGADRARELAIALAGTRSRK